MDSKPLTAPDAAWVCEEPGEQRLLLASPDGWPLRHYLLDSFNKSTLDDGATPLGNGEITILKDMESFDQEHDQYMQDLKCGSHQD